MNARKILSGLVLAGAYVVVTLTSQRAGLLPVRPLYEGVSSPMPYNWVSPPPELKQNNKQPAIGEGDVTFKNGVAEAANIVTNDAQPQAVLLIPPGGIAPRAGETKVHVKITPLDPEPIGAPPATLSYDGNAYKIEAVYTVSGAPAEIPATSCPTNTAAASKCATVVLRYVFASAKDIVRRDGDVWTQLNATVAGGALQTYGLTNTLGTFVVVDHGAQKKPAGGGGSFIAFAAGLAAILLGTGLMRLRSGKRTRAAKAEAQAKRKRRAGRKGP